MDIYSGREDGDRFPVASIHGRRLGWFVPGAVSGPRLFDAEGDFGGLRLLREW